MWKLGTMAAAGLIATSLAAAPVTPASAHDEGCGPACAIGVFAAGAAAIATIATIANSTPDYYAPAPGYGYYAPPPVAYAPAPVYYAPPTYYAPPAYYAPPRHFVRYHWHDHDRYDRDRR